MTKLPIKPLIFAAVFGAAWIAGQDTQERYDEIDRNPLTEGWTDTKPSDCDQPNWINLRWLDECVLGDATQ